MNPIEKHRRDVRLRVIAPVAIPALALIVLAIALLVSVASGGLVAKQITVAMSILASAFILLPMVLLCVVPYALLAAGAAGMGLAYSKAQVPLRFVRRITAQITVKTKQLAPRVAQPVIGMNTRLARLESMARGWQDTDSDWRKGQS